MKLLERVSGSQDRLLQSIEEACLYAMSKGWPELYLLLDLHKTVFPASYSGTTSEAYPYAVEVLRLLNKHSVKIILWSSVKEEDKAHYLKWFKDQGIEILGFNENPDYKETSYASFREKPYFSFLFDDKAGFRPEDWRVLYYKLS